MSHVLFTLKCKICNHLALAILKGKSFVNFTYQCFPHQPVSLAAVLESYHVMVIGKNLEEKFRQIFFKNTPYLDISLLDCRETQLTKHF